ncbi:MAG TPA: hypothetical protein VNS02_02515 [Rhizobiaceae bacterium]|nr:hypothetical protein [Rhizobiaceae bacterium]
MKKVGFNMIDGEEFPLVFADIIAELHADDGMVVIGLASDFDGSGIGPVEIRCRIAMPLKSAETLAAALNGLVKLAQETPSGRA